MIVLPEWTVVTRTATNNPAWQSPAASAIERGVLEPAAVSSVDGANLTPVRERDISDRYRHDATQRDAFSWGAGLSWLYRAGVIVMLIQLARQQWSVQCLARRASELCDREWVALLNESPTAWHPSFGATPRSREQSMPMAFGTRRPAILIPATADTWPEDRRRAVILHELAHVARYDCLTQLLAFAACTLYWFHPAVWWVARRLRVERELACDDRVIAAGAPARDYAGHLLEIA